MLSFNFITDMSNLGEFIFFCTGFEVHKVVRIYNAVWVMAPCSLVRGYECSGEAFWVCLHRLSKDGLRTS